MISDTVSIVDPTDKSFDENDEADKSFDEADKSFDENDEADKSFDENDEADKSFDNPKENPTEEQKAERKREFQKQLKFQKKFKQWKEQMVEEMKTVKLPQGCDEHPLEISNENGEYTSENSVSARILTHIFETQRKAAKLDEKTYQETINGWKKNDLSKNLRLTAINGEEGETYLPLKLVHAFAKNGNEFAKNLIATYSNTITTRKLTLPDGQSFELKVIMSPRIEAIEHPDVPNVPNEASEANEPEDDEIENEFKAQNKKNMETPEEARKRYVWHAAIVTMVKALVDSPYVYGFTPIQSATVAFKLVQLYVVTDDITDYNCTVSKDGSLSLNRLCWRYKPVEDIVDKYNAESRTVKGTRKDQRSSATLERLRQKLAKNKSDKKSPLEVKPVEVTAN